ncbi:MAG: hypothetical protein WD049_05810 [Candidatus Paceibacterota bacterium]
MNQNDTKRHQILKWFYDRNANATSQRGKKGAAVKISDVKKGLKEAYAMKPADVMSNLTYLIDKGWINQTDIERSVQTSKGTTFPSTATWYQISSAGIDKIEGESDFQANHRYAGININATGQNIVTLGDGNVIHADNETLDRELASLKHQIAGSTKLDDAEKLDASVDIETLRDQLVKAKPDETVVQHLWSRIQQVATMNGFTEAVTKLAPLIGGLVG